MIAIFLNPYLNKNRSKKESGLDEASSVNKQDADSGGDGTWNMHSKPEK